MGIGICTDGASRYILPGEPHARNAKDTSIGYHNDEGRIWTSSHDLKPADKYTEKDRVGCYLYQVDGTQTVQFTLNGQKLVCRIFKLISTLTDYKGKAETLVDSGFAQEVYPCVGIRIQGDGVGMKVRANFQAEWNPAEDATPSKFVEAEKADK